MKFKTILFSLLPAVALTAGEVKLSNGNWTVKIDPENGFRASSIVYKPAGKELVNSWKVVQKRRGKVTRGGVWGGHMGGSYQDEQVRLPYRVTHSDSKQVVGIWENKFLNFDGLREERTVALNGAEIKVKVKITNNSKVKRTFIYRMQDFLGLRNDGQNCYGFVRGAAPEAFPFYDYDRPECVFMNPEENSIAMFDYVRDYGILISCTKKVNGIYTWFHPRMDGSTIEFFIEQEFLEPGAEWVAEFSYRGFSPSKLSTLPEKWQKWLNQDNVTGILNLKGKDSSLLPYHSVCKLNLNADKLSIFPVSAADRAAGKGYPAVHRMSLDSMKLFGTPGERVDFVLALKAGNKKINSAWGFNPFIAEKKGWNPFGVKSVLHDLKCDLRYLSTEGFFLVHDQKLTGRNDELCSYGNALKDSEKWSDLSLEPGGIAWVKISCYIPENAVAGTYNSTLSVAGESVKISLDVLPFKLNRKDAKAFGSFFRAYITPPKKNPEWAMNKEEFLETLRFAGSNWNNSIVIYTMKQDELIWTVDQLYKLGWRNSVICPVYRLLSTKQIKDFEAKYGYTFLTWGYDEPATYRALSAADRRLDSILKAKYKNPTFTPSTFMGALYADIRKEYIPIFNTNGLMTILMDRTRRYAAEKRMVFWYSCPTGMLSVRDHLKERILHGVYLWKMPVKGIFDWGEDVHSKRGRFCGFIGKKFISTIRRDNNYEGYKDYLYLKTLQEIAEANPKVPASAAARSFLKNLSDLLDDDYYTAVIRVDDSYLNSIREEAARLAAAIINEK